MELIECIKMKFFIMRVIDNHSKIKAMVLCVPQGIKYYINETKENKGVWF